MVNMGPPKSVKECNSFCEVVNFLSSIWASVRREASWLIKFVISSIRQISWHSQRLLAKTERKTKLITDILLDYKIWQAQDRVLNTSMFQMSYIFSEGYLVYILEPHPFSLQLGTAIFSQNSIGPLLIAQC